MIPPSMRGWVRFQVKLLLGLVEVAIPQNSVLLCHTRQFVCRGR